jgi:hypothetical protein
VLCRPRVAGGARGEAEEGEGVADVEVGWREEEEFDA